MSIISGPVAPYSNVPIEPENYSPSNFPITNISLGQQTLVTTGTAFGVHNNYVKGQLVRFIIPPTYGCRQLNEMQGYVVDKPGTDQILVNIDTSIGFNAFIPSPPYGPTPPQVMAIGDVNTGAINAQGRINQQTFIDGSFRDVSF